MKEMIFKVTHFTRAGWAEASRSDATSRSSSLLSLLLLFFFASISLIGTAIPHRLEANMTSVNKDSDNGENNPDLSPTSPAEDSDTAPVPEPEPRPGLHGAPVRCKFRPERSIICPK